MVGKKQYSCTTAAETLEWVNAIVRFIESYDFFINAHVTDFFTQRLWESINEDWMDCLHEESLLNISLIPSGVIQEHWPLSLKEFVQTLKLLSFPRDQADLCQFFSGFNVINLTTVLAQGMNDKKRHEVQILSAVVSELATSVGAQKIVDVGSGQGYLSQVLSFQYLHSVVAVDSNAHNSRVSEARAQRIIKHYNSKMRKLSSEHEIAQLPTAITCRVNSVDSLKSVTAMSVHSGDLQHYKTSLPTAENVPSLILTGLHACGDLSGTMLKTFAQCEEVKAIVSVGCCYNLLSEANHDLSCGFPMSEAAKSAGLSLPKTARDLACQSAERWSILQDDDCVQNFKLHAFRAAFQLVLHRYFPCKTATNPCIGRQGKALRRKQQSRKNQSTFSCSTDGIDVDELKPFKSFCLSALSRMNLQQSEEIDFIGIWKEVEPFAPYVGPYWSLRAAFGPVLETLILLDRLLFLQEHPNVQHPQILPIFNPAISPRNLAIIAKKGK